MSDQILRLEKMFGKGVVMKLGDKPTEKVPVIPSGSYKIDKALGIGGYPIGRTVEIYGPESSGKTTLALHAIAECQKMGKKCLFVDAEHAFDRTYAQNLGIDTDELLLTQPDDGNQALEVVDAMIQDDDIGLIVVDSVAALVPRAELEGEMGDSKMGLRARLMNQGLIKITGKMNKHKCCVIFINQMRYKIGVVYGNPETTTGGEGLKFYASVRLDVRRKAISEKDKQGNALSNHVHVKVVKNKLAPPFRKAEIEIIYGKGINRMGEILDVAVDAGVVEKAGSWYSYEGAKLAQGKLSTYQVLMDNPEMLEEITSKL